MAAPAPPRGTPVSRPRPAGRSRSSANPLPLIVAVAALVLSLVIAVVLAVTSASAPIAFLTLTLKLVTPGWWWLSLIGYVLTPVAVIACYGWDSVGQRNGLRENRDFVLRPSWSRALLWCAGISIVVGAWHVLNLSVPLTEAWGLS